MMTNLHRGEIEAHLGGQTYRLVLTLGALAELEHAFGAGDLVGLAGRFEAGRMRARDLVAIIGCGLRGAGAALSDYEVAGLSHANGLPGYVDVVARLLAATFGEAPVPHPPKPQAL
jgi:hypothetical protein